MSDDGHESMDEDQGGHFELTEAQLRDRAEQEAKIAEFELRRQIKSTVVPTDDGKVRQMLRALAEPVTLFGERQMERRERLQRIVALREASGEAVPTEALLAGGQLVLEEAPVHKEKFYTEGSAALQAARVEIARWSLPRAAARVRAARALHDDVAALRAARAERERAERAAAALAQQSSEIGDDRPIGGASISGGGGDGSRLATCGWGGAVATWAIRGDGFVRAGGWRAHAERATDVAWRPGAAPSDDGGAEGGGGAEGPGPLALATGCADGTAALWDVSGGLLRRLAGHTDRLGRIAWHPMGRHLATASFDLTWRMWDAETGAALLEQEGHSRAVYSVAFHPDGSLAGSAGCDAITRIWDVRTGRCVLTLEGHVKPVLTLDFCADGYRLATGGEDHTARVWDLRAKRCSYTVAAHTSLVSAVRWAPAARGGYLLTASYDGLAKVWGGRDYKLLRALAGHEGKVMAAALGPDDDGRHVVATASYDRTIKLWRPDALLGGGEGEGGEGGGDAEAMAI